MILREEPLLNLRGGPMRAASLTGIKFGRLTALSVAGGRTMSGRTRWAYHCKCDCGADSIVMGKNLLAGNSKSCGCLKRDLNAQCLDNVEWINPKVEVDPITNCWLWVGRCWSTGYGKLSGRGGGAALAHRVVYRRFVGIIPAKHDLDHLRRVRRCVNPAHLEPVTRSENLRRGRTGKWHRERTVCSKGHPLCGGNVIHNVRAWTNADGRKTGYATRLCRICSNARRRRRRLNAKAGA